MRTETAANDDQNISVHAVPLKTRTDLLMEQKEERKKNTPVRNVIRIRYRALFRADKVKWKK